MKTAHSLLATAIAAGLMFSTGAQARNKLDTPEINKSGFVFTLGYYQGGQDISPIDLIDPSTGEVVGEQKVRAGNGILLTLGYRLPLGDSPLSIQFNGGLFNQYEDFYDSGDPFKDKMYIKRSIAEIVPFYNFDQQQRIGLGLTYHINPNFYFAVTDTKTDPDNPTQYTYDWRLDNALGWVIQYDYQLTNYLQLGARYMRVDYDYKDTKFYNGNTFGINLGMSY